MDQFPGIGFAGSAKNDQDKFFLPSRPRPFLVFGLQTLFLPGLGHIGFLKTQQSLFRFFGGGISHQKQMDFFPISQVWSQHHVSFEIQAENVLLGHKKALIQKDVAVEVANALFNKPSLPIR